MPCRLGQFGSQPKKDTDPYPTWVYGTANFSLVVLGGYEIDGKSPVRRDEINKVKAGSTEPLKFSVTDSLG
jgi:CRISPR/Cas system CSM-associated protein Csm4 (group 5 of RAMP superfamily)